MTERVWKFVVTPSRAGTGATMMPVAAEVLSVGAQGDDLVVWALVDPERATPGVRTFIVVGTGHDLPAAPRGRFLGTAQMGALVWHVWEPLRRRPSM